MAIDYTGKLPCEETDCTQIENLITNALARQIAKSAGVVIQRSPVGLYYGMFHTPVRSCSVHCHRIYISCPVAKSDWDCLTDDHCPNNIQVAAFSVRCHWPRARQVGASRRNDHEAEIGDCEAWHQLILEFQFSIYASDAACQLKIINGLDSCVHGTHVVIPKMPKGFSRFAMTTFGKPYIHPYYRILSLGLGDLENLHSGSAYPVIDPRIEE